MNKQKYEQLMFRLNNYLVVDSKVTIPDPLYITSGMDMDSLNESQLIMIHARLHQFYGQGGIKLLNKEDIEILHKEIKRRINHSDFDSLDRK